MRRMFALEGRAAHLLRRLVVSSVSIACAMPATSPAQPSGVVVDPAAFDKFFQQGDQQFGRGEYLEAARTWSEAARHLPIIDSENRRGLYDYIAGAYEKALEGSADSALLAEAVRVLDEYVVAYSAAHPQMTLASKGRIAHDRLRAHLAAIATQPSVQPPPESSIEAPDLLPVPTVGARPWKNLAIGGGVATGLGAVMLGMFIGGYVRTQQLEREIGGYGPCPEETCPNLYKMGRRADVAAVFGLVAAPLFLGAGATMLGLALVRRKGSNRAKMPLPVLGHAMVGLIWQHRF